MAIEWMLLFATEGLGLYGVYIGILELKWRLLFQGLGLYSAYIGIMEKKRDTTIPGLGCGLGFRV